MSYINMGFLEDNVVKLANLAREVPFILQLSIAFKISVESLMVGAMSGLLFLILLGICPNATTTMIAAAPPMYLTLKVLEFNKTNDTKHCLIYWLIFGLWCYLETFIDFFLSILPFYSILKICGLIYLF